MIRGKIEKEGTGNGNAKKLGNVIYVYLKRSFNIILHPLQEMTINANTIYYFQKIR